MADDKQVPAATMRSVPDEERVETLLRVHAANGRVRDALAVTWSGKRSELLSSG